MPIAGVCYRSVAHRFVCFWHGSLVPTVSQESIKMFVQCHPAFFDKQKMRAGRDDTVVLVG
jgi:hypothetical protein